MYQARYPMHHYTPAAPASSFAADLPRPDLRSRAKMTEYLLKHPRYGVNFAREVKLTALNIPFELLDNAYEMLELQPHGETVNSLFDAFRKEFGDGTPENRHGGVGNIRIGMEGRSGGYIVMYNAEADQDYPALEMGELRRIVRLVFEFDLLCDDVVYEFMHYVENYHAESEEYTETITRTARVLVENAAPVDSAYDEGYQDAHAGVSNQGEGYPEHIDSYQAGYDAGLKARDW